MRRVEGTRRRRRQTRLLMDDMEGKAAAAEHETYDSEGEGTDDDETATGQSDRSVPHSWIEVKLSEQAVKASAELKGEDVGRRRECGE